MNFKTLSMTGAAALALGLTGPALAYQEAQAEEAVEAAEEAMTDVGEAMAGAAEAMEDAAEAVMEEPAGPANHTPEGSPHFIPLPPEGKGQIVFYRSTRMGFAMGCTINQGTKKDKTKISSLGAGKYVIVAAEPGKQDYWVKNEKKDAITLLVEEGETQFVECRIKMGFMSGRPDLSPSDAAEFVEKGENLKLVDDDDMGEGALRSTDLAAAQ
ncbi:hypothetical protein [Altererythrobacter lutimaris]|uniref:DUF2846 domain-containing protein n=1 Tax=Altererythrobacter lutimaris TaxID=2743979 RepID=A0A850HCB8_9SPHN|nr:hypothetical protein [Altererythrobacter lutimaris]NVE94268.1 hypothetical protein [Altererythrobacter lutimaris]